MPAHEARLWIAVWSRSMVSIGTLGWVRNSPVGSPRTEMITRFPRALTRASTQAETSSWHSWPGGSLNQSSQSPSSPFHTSLAFDVSVLVSFSAHEMTYLRRLKVATCSVAVERLGRLLIVVWFRAWPASASRTERLAI